MCHFWKSKSVKLYARMSSNVTILLENKIAILADILTLNEIILNLTLTDCFSTKDQIYKIEQLFSSTGTKNTWAGPNVFDDCSFLPRVEWPKEIILCSNQLIFLLSHYYAYNLNCALLCFPCISLIVTYVILKLT